MLPATAESEPGTADTERPPKSTFWVQFDSIGCDPGLAMKEIKHSYTSNLHWHVHLLE